MSVTAKFEIVQYHKDGATVEQISKIVKKTEKYIFGIIYEFEKYGTVTVKSRMNQMKPNM